MYYISYCYKEKYDSYLQIIITTSSWHKIMKILTCLSLQKKLKDSEIITENQ